jgi:ankyrin repeat protein
VHLRRCNPRGHLTVRLRARAQDGWTPLHITAAAGNVEAAQLLLHHGARLESIIKVGASVIS